jgi:hypothetical protein
MKWEFASRLSLCWCWFLWEIGRSRSSFIEAHGRRDERAIGKRGPYGRQEIGSEPRLYDIAQPARIECGPGIIGVFVDREEHEPSRLLQAP